MDIRPPRRPTLRPGGTRFFAVTRLDDLFLSLLQPRRVLLEKRLENGSMTPGLVGAVAPHRERRLVGEAREEAQQPRGGGTLHLAPVALDERLPPALLPGPQRDLDEILRRRQLRQPEIVEVTGGELRLRHSPRGAPNGAQAQPLAWSPGFAELYDPDRHRLRSASTLSRLSRRSRSFAADG